jgi:thioredoxin 1
MSALTAVTDADFATTVLASDKPVLVDFWAEWCGPCRQIAPILEQIAAEHPEALRVVKMDVDANQATASTYRITGVPTLAVFSGGEVVKQMTGAKPKAALLADLADYLG